MSALENSKKGVQITSLEVRKYEIMGKSPLEDVIVIDFTHFLSTYHFSRRLSNPEEPFSLLKNLTP